MLASIEQGLSSRLAPYWKALNEATRWSNLATLGNSPVAKLTVLAPFLGHLVFYNYAIAEILFGLRDDGTASWLEKLQGSHRLSLLYLGLVFFGIGSALYGAFAPRVIKRHPAVETYLLEADEIATAPMTTRALDRIVAAHPAGRFNYPATPAPEGGFIYFPEDLEIEVDQLLVFLGENSGSLEPDGPDSDPESQQDLLHNDMGRIDVEKVLQVLRSKARVIRPIWVEMEGVAFEHRKRDVFFLEHWLLDYSSAHVRAIVASLHLVGVILLFIPTVATVFTVFHRLVVG